MVHDDSDEQRLELCLAYLEGNDVTVEALSRFFNDELDIIRAEALDYILSNVDHLRLSFLAGIIPEKDQSWIVRGRVRLAWALLGKYDRSNILRYGDINDNYDILWHFAAEYVISRQKYIIDIIAKFATSDDLTLASASKEITSYLSKIKGPPITI